MDYQRSLGIGQSYSPQAREQIIKYINLKLAAQGLPIYEKAETKELEIASELLASFQEKTRIFADKLCPADERIQTFLNDFLADVNEEIPHLPATTFILDRFGIARELALPPDANEFKRDAVTSYRTVQGILHNPANDRRTTKGVFHIAEGGLPVPPDKKSVPKITFLRLLKAALQNASEDLLQLPFTANQEKQAATFVSLLMRPMVVPEVAGITAKKTMEVRFFAPGNLVSNLDFVESIFGNAGDPYLAAHDAALDPKHWTGHTGCVILAPQMLKCTKKELGLPHISEATERQKKDKMCWEKEDETYNDGGAFKICARTDAGVIITLIADNYFGYCKKEVKTQIGYSANLFGMAEEEHAGGALACPSYNLGSHFIQDSNIKSCATHTMENVKKCLGDSIIMMPEGYAIDKKYPTIFYVPENCEITLEPSICKWTKNGKEFSLKVLPERVFIHPTGFRIRIEKHPASVNWRLVGTQAEGTLIHKPCTVSGGGKSEISKSVYDATLYGPLFISDFEKDLDFVEEIINKNYSCRFKSANCRPEGYTSRKILSSQRSLGSVIKLLNPSNENSDEFNSWLKTIPSRIKSLIFSVKRFYKDSWGNDWRKHFTVDVVNGELGHELKYENRKIIGSYLRVGLRKDGSWSTFKLRQDFMPSEKIQWEDDISASVMVPSKNLKGLNPEYKNPSIKIVENCEYRFFQRPDDAKVRGYDKQAELDLATEGVFASNFEPLQKKDAIDMIEDSANFGLFTQPMQDVIKTAANGPDNGYFVCSANARIVDGKPSKNVRYLQTRPALLDYRPTYLSQISTRLHRQIEEGKPVYFPVNATMPGRRNNPAEPGIRPLAVYNPVHFQELPELFMDFTASLTGKSPSTTGAGTEGALTKAPFNALVATSDLNNALLSFILGGYNGFTTAAGHIGAEHAVEHDISLLIPEIWSRMTETERDPKNMIERKFLEKLEDFEHNGKKVLASRLGYRITDNFVNFYLGRVFETPKVVFPETMLKPELQNVEEFVDGINNICETLEKVGKEYISCGADKAAIEPLKAILHCMAKGEYNGKNITDPEIRKFFSYDYVINSDWYKERLIIKQSRDICRLEIQIQYLSKYINEKKNADTVEKLKLKDKLAYAEKELINVKSAAYLESLVGTIGADPLFRG